MNKLVAKNKVPVHQIKKVGPYGKSLFEANKAWIINTPAACMLLMRKWQLKMHGMFIRGEWKESAYGLWRVRISWLPILMKQVNYMNRPWIKSIAILHSTIFQMR